MRWLLLGVAVWLLLLATLVPINPAQDIARAGLGGALVGGAGGAGG